MIKIRKMMLKKLNGRIIMKLNIFKNIEKSSFCDMNTNKDLILYLRNVKIKFGTKQNEKSKELKFVV